MAEISSNGVPFEVLEDDIPATQRIGMQVEVYDQANPNQLIDILPRRKETQFLREVKGTGGGAFQIHQDDAKLAENPSILAAKNIVKCRLDGQISAAFLIEDVERVYADRSEDSGRLWSVAGPGLRAWLADATVHPYGGLRLRSGSSRVFSFASERGSWYKPADWTAPVNVAQYDLDPVGNTSPWGTAPAEWPDNPTAYWIWDRANSNALPAPEGYCFFRCEFTAPADDQYAVFMSADDEFDVYMDGALILTSQETNAYAKTWRADFDLEAGAHILAVRVKNKGGRAGLIAALKRYGNEELGTPATTISETGDGLWKVNGYPDPSPGWTPGEIMLTLLAEAAARDIRMASTLIPTFTAEEDSEGVTWPRSLDWEFDIGADYSTVVAKLEELACDVWIDPANYQLNMSADRGTRRDEQTESVQPVKFEIGRNVVRAGERSVSAIKNTLLVQTADGWELQTDGVTSSIETYGVVEGMIRTNASSAVSGDVARATFSQFSEPQKSATFEIIDLDDARPLVDFEEADWVLAPGETGLESRRVMSISFKETRTGSVEFALEFDTIFQDKEVRLERWLETTAAGTLGGSVQNSSGSGSGTGIPASQSARTGPPGPPGADGDPGITWRGEWSVAINYVFRDVVSYQGSSWIAIAANVGVAPSSDITKWNLVAKAGQGLTLLGTLAAEGDLPATDNAPGDAYLIDGDLWVWDGADWQNVGSIEGPAGPPGTDGTDGADGAPGAPGADGASAYEVAVANGFVGTEAAWLESLVGADGAPGADGNDGAPGADGDSAYEIAVANGFVGTEAAWLASLEGTPGADGEDGEPGPGLVILGSLATEGDLPATGDPGDAYIIAGDLWVWSVALADWINVGNLEGPAGPPGTDGADGAPGADGDSAYEVAVANGFVGTEAAWLASLVGADGDPGAPGADGDSAYEIAVENGFVGTEAAWLASLVGPEGPPGADGTDGVDGTALMPARAVAVYTTGSLANNAEETGTIAMATAYRLLRISLDEPARVRVYATVAQRTADATRPVGTDPTGDHGLMLEFVGTEALLAMTLSPSVDGASMETVPSTNIPIAVANLSGATDTIQVSLTYLRTE